MFGNNKKFGGIILCRLYYEYSHRRMLMEKNIAILQFVCTYNVRHFILNCINMYVDALHFKIFSRLHHRQWKAQRRKYYNCYEIRSIKAR